MNNFLKCEENRIIPKSLISRNELMYGNFRQSKALEIHERILLIFIYVLKCN